MTGVFIKSRNLNTDVQRRTMLCDMRLKLAFSWARRKTLEEINFANTLILNL